MATAKNEIKKSASFVTVDTLTDKFKYVNSRMPVLEKNSLELKVETKEHLVIAENNALETHTLIKEVDSIRKLLKEPYATTVKQIDTYCKLIDDSLSRIKIRFTTQIATFKSVQEAQARIERDKKLKEIEELETAKTDESGKITRIESQLVARIFGGTYATKDGLSKSVTGCIKSSDCDDLLIWMNENAPSVKSFVHFATLYEDMMASVSKKLADHRNNLLDLETKGDIGREGAIRKINESRVDASQNIQVTALMAERMISKDIRKETKMADNVVTESGKGMRDTLSYKITDEALIPRDMLSLDVSKLMSYINANKDKIKESLTKNEETIPGIKFFVASKFITR